mgnify:CR=1 FL=1
MTSTLDGIVRPALEALVESQHQRRRSHRRANHSGGACARGQPRRSSGSLAEERDVRASEPAGKVERLHRRHERRAANCSSSKAIRPVGRLSRAATARVRLSCRCAARFSTPRAPHWRGASKNKELSDLVTAIGCGLGKNFDLSKLRYGKIIILARRRLGRQSHRDASAVHSSTAICPSSMVNGKIFLRAAAALSHRYRQRDILGAGRRAHGMRFSSSTPRTATARLLKLRDSKASAR